MLTVEHCNVVLLQHSVSVRVEKVEYKGNKAIIGFNFPEMDIKFWLVIEGSYFCFYEDENLVRKPLGGYESSNLLHPKNDYFAHFEYIVKRLSHPEYDNFSTLCRLIRDRNEHIKIARQVEKETGIQLISSEYAFR